MKWSFTDHQNIDIKSRTCFIQILQIYFSMEYNCVLIVDTLSKNPN